MADKRRKKGKSRRENDRIGRSLYYLFAIGVIVIATIFAYNFGYSLFDQTPIDEAPGREEVVVIEYGDSVMDIAAQLKNANLIRNKNIFVAQERISGYHGKLQAGTYTLNSSWSPNLIMAVLALDTAKAQENDIDLASVASIPQQE